MFQNRHSFKGGSHQMKLPNIPDYLDRLREEYSMLQNQVQTLRVESDKKNQEVEAMKGQMVSYMEMMAQFQFESVKNMEVTKRMTSVFQHVLPLLPVEHQASAAQALERSKNVTTQEVMQLVQQQQQMPMPLLAGAGMLPPSFNPFFPMKPEDMNAFAAQMAGMNPKFPFMPPVGHPLLNMANMQASTSHNGASSSHNLPTSSASGHKSSVNNSRPHSGEGTPALKKAKTEVEETDGELEIDVQNDDVAASVKSGTNGTGKSKDGRESAQSVSSRASSATPKSQKPINLPNNFPGGQMPNLNNFFMNANGHRPLGIIDPNRLLPLSNNEAPPYAYKRSGSSPLQPVQFPSDAFDGPEVPKSLTKVTDLVHGDVVCAVTVSPSGERVYTGGKGCIKVWDISKPKETSLAAISTLECLEDQYIRSCKLLKDSGTLLVGGEYKDICVVDINTEKIIRTLDCDAQACYALVVSEDGKYCYSSCADGKIIIWDLTSFERVGVMKGHEDGASCVDLTPDEKRLWSGGLDNTVVTWDIGERKAIKKFEFENQVFSLSCSPTDDWVAVGMESSNVEVINANNDEKYVLQAHENCVLSLKFAHSGKWFCSTGKDSHLITWRSPFGARLVKKKQDTSVLSCDISSDDRYIVVGAGDKRATLYEVSY